MPIYVYEIIRKDGKPGRRFEVKQALSEKPLRKDPQTGKLVRRVFMPVNSPKNKYEKALKQSR